LFRATISALRATVISAAVASTWPAAATSVEMRPPLVGQLEIRSSEICGSATITAVTSMNANDDPRVVAERQLCADGPSAPPRHRPGLDPSSAGMS
jgi:hypothetical protein